jgi:hypothetical protein
MDPTVSAQDPLREFTGTTISLVAQHDRDIAALKANEVTTHEQKGICRKERMDAEDKLGGRMTTLEKALSETNGALQGTNNSLRTFIEVHDKAAASEDAKRDTAAKAVEGHRGRSVQLVGYIIGLVGVLGAAYAKYLSDVAASNMPAMLTKAAAEGAAQAIKAIGAH